MEKESMKPADDEIRPNETPFGKEPAENQGAAAEFPSAAAVEPAPESRFKKIGPWLGAVLASLAAGAALIFFLLYLPASSSLRQAQTDLSSAESALAAAEAKAAELEGQLTSATGELETTQAELHKAKLSLAVSRLQANISYARLALLNKDVLTARQELSGAEANLAELTLLLDDRETSSALADRLKTVRANLTSDPAKALDEMRTLGENLARLENR